MSVPPQAFDDIVVDDDGQAASEHGDSEPAWAVGSAVAGSRSNVLDVSSRTDAPDRCFRLRCPACRLGGGPFSGAHVGAALRLLESAGMCKLDDHGRRVVELAALQAVASRRPRLS